MRLDMPFAYRKSRKAVVYGLSLGQSTQKLKSPRIKKREAYEEERKSIKREKSSRKETGEEDVSAR